MAERHIAVIRPAYGHASQGVGRMPALAAVARLRADLGLALPELWALVSAGPARAMGLADRGALAPGLRADLVLLDWPEAAAPAVAATFVAGRLAHAGPAMAGRIG